MARPRKTTEEKTDEGKLRGLLSGLYADRKAEQRISPAWLATEALQKLDPDRASPTLVYQAAHLELRQAARSICREKAGGGDFDGEQHELFPALQKRYPAAYSSDVEPEYVLLEHMSEADVRANVQRLRRESESKMAHADALEAWWQNTRAVA